MPIVSTVCNNGTEWRVEWVGIDCRMYVEECTGGSEVQKYWVILFSEILCQMSTVFLFGWFSIHLTQQTVDLDNVAKSNGMFDNWNDHQPNNY